MNRDVKITKILYNECVSISEKKGTFIKCSNVIFNIFSNISKEQ